MYQSQLFVKTKKEAPKEAEIVSHKLLTRGDFIEQLASGIYVFLPLGLRVQKKIEDIIREELESIGAQELLMSALQPKILWEKTGRWSTMDPPLLKLKDRHQKELALGSTHEEVITYIVSRRMENFGDLPISLFQIQNKFRDEMRATGGLLRTREFLMKDLYSFHADQKDFDKYYELLKKVYQKIFKRCGLETIITEASGAGFFEKPVRLKTTKRVISRAIINPIFNLGEGLILDLLYHTSNGACPVIQPRTSCLRQLYRGSVLSDSASYYWDIIINLEA